MKLFQQFEEDIYRMAYVYVKNKEDALDVVQEVAYQSFKKIDMLKEPKFFKTWVIKIAINCAINIVKKNNKVVHLNLNYEEFKGIEDVNVPLSLSIQEMIDTLEEDEKSIILLRFYHDYTFKEISKLLDIPLGTAKSALYRALDKLRKEYKEADICE